MPSHLRLAHGHQELEARLREVRAPVGVWDELRVPMQDVNESHPPRMSSLLMEPQTNYSPLSYQSTCGSLWHCDHLHLICQMPFQLQIWTTHCVRTH